MTAVYLVSTPSGDRLIEAANRASAINFAARTTITARALSASETVALMRKGIEVEVGTPAPAPDLLAPTAQGGEA